MKEVIETDKTLWYSRAVSGDNNAQALGVWATADGARYE
jgi:hypothetical protein